MPRSLASRAAWGYPIPGLSALGRPLAFLFSTIWVLIVADPLVDLYRTDASTPTLAMSTIVIVAFIATYGWTVAKLNFRRRSWRSPFTDRQRLAVRLGLGALTIGMLAWQGDAWAGMIIFAVLGTVLTAASHRALADGAVMLLVLAAALVVVGTTSGQFAWAIGFAAFWGVVISSIVGQDDRIADLVDEKVAAHRIAAAEERERISRELHDSLGHDLSLLSIKSELTGKLLDQDPARARGEIADIERLSRDALARVRTVIAGEREPVLASELHRANEMLMSAGISLTSRPLPDALPAPVTSVFAWAVREGAMNVLKHSGATTCDLAVTRDAQGWLLAITDNGTNVPGEPGNGLDGLRQRAMAIGGTADFDAATHTLTVRVPHG